MAHALLEQFDQVDLKVIWHATLEVTPAGNDCCVLIGVRTSHTATHVL